MADASGARRASVGCLDAFDRPRESAVMVRDGRVIFMTPAGNIAQYNAAQLSKLIEELQLKRTELYGLEP